MNCSRQPAFLAVRRSPFWPLLWIRCMLRTPQMSKRKSLKRHFVRCSVAFQLFSVRGVTAKARFSRYFILHLPAILQSRWLHFSAARFQLNAVGELNAGWASLCLQRVYNRVGMILFLMSTILMDEGGPSPQIYTVSYVWTFEFQFFSIFRYAIFQHKSQLD